MATIRLILGLAVIGATLVAPGTLSASAVFVDDDAPAGGNGLSWNTAFRHLQDALSAAEIDLQIDEIRVAGGIYKPDLAENVNVVPGSRSESFPLRDGLRLLGGFAGLAGGANPDLRDPDQFVSILSGDLAGNDGPNFQNRSDNSLHVVRATNIAVNTILDGFTISGGNANAVAPNDSGGGLLIKNSNVLITDCLITGNQTAGCQGNFCGGGGISISGVGADGQAAMRRCTVAQNMTLARGGGLRLLNAEGFQMHNCHFVANQAVSGGGVSSENHVAGVSHSFTNALFNANQSSDTGGAFLILGSNDSIINCTIAQNSAGIEGGGLFIQGVDGVDIVNTLIWENEDLFGQSFFAQVALGGLGQAAIEYS